jgi:ABC-type multidrug transport system fused ATPase/permease subunit
MIFFKKLLSLFDKREKPKVFLLMVMIFLGACLEIMGIGLVLPFISLISDPSLIDRYTAFSHLKNLTGDLPYNSMLTLLGLILLLFYLAKNLYMANLFLIQNRFIYKKMHALSLTLFGSYLSAPYVFHLRRNSSELQRNINISVLQVFNVLFIYTLYLISDALVLLAIFSLLIFIDPLTTIIAGFVVLLAAGIFFKVIRNKIHTLGELDHHNVGQMIKWVNQGLASIKETKILGNEEFFLNAYSKYCGEYVRSRRFTATVQEMPRLFLETLAVVGMLTIILLFLIQGRDIQSVIPLIALFAVAAFRMIPSTNRIIRSMTVIRQYTPALDVVVKDLEIGESGPREHSISPGAPGETGQGEGLSFKNEIVLDGIHYRYPDTQEDVLHSISLKIRRGQSVAFVGSSGSGKTTIVDIILGLLTPTGGNLLADGYDIQGDLRGWQSLFGYIPQSIYLMDDTIRRNIAFGVQDSVIDEEAVWKALCSAQLDEFIQNLPDGLDTLVGEAGVRLSGGQRQRIGIARALYHEPEVLILDEATSSLDNETEQAVSDAINHLSGEKTIIIIAHRLSTVEHCERLFFLKDGRLADSGTFSHLISSSSEFQAMAGQK